MKLTWKLAIAFAVVSGLVWVVGMYAVSRSQRETRRLLVAESMHLGSEVLEHLVQTAGHRIDEVREYAASPLFVDALRRLSADGQHAAAEVTRGDEQIDRLWRQGVVDPELHNRLVNNPLSVDLQERVAWKERAMGLRTVGEMFVTETRGVLVALSGMTTDYVQSDETWWIKARDEGIYVEPVEFDASSGLRTMSLGVRIDDPQAGDPAGRFLGVMKVTLNVEEAVQVIEQAFGGADGLRARDARAALLTHEGKLICTTGDSQRARLLFDRAAAQLGDQRPRGWFSTRLDGNRLHVVRLVRQGRDHMPGWVLLLDYDSEAIFAPTRRIRRGIVRISVAGTLCAILLGLVIGWPLRRRLAALTRAADAIRAGRLDVALPAPGRDEVGRLSSAFGQVRDTLRDMSLSLKDVIVAVNGGRLDRRSEADRFEGEFADLVHGINLTADSMMGHLDAVPVPMVLMDRRFRVVFANRAALQLAGFGSLDEVLDRPCRSFWGEDNCTGVCCPRDTMESGLPSETVKEVVLQGKQAVLRISAVPLRDASGEVVGAMEVLVDQTEMALQNRVQQSVLSVSETLAGQAELDDIIDKALRVLMSVTRSHVGAVYLGEEDDPDRFVLTRTIGANPELHLPATIERDRSFFAGAVIEHEVKVAEDIDPERFRLDTLGGQAAPKCLVDVPLVVQDRVVGVLCLASLYGLDESRRLVLEMVRSQLAVAVTNARANRATRELAEKLQLSNEELNAGNEELKVQSEELRQQALELREQTVRLHQQQQRIQEADRLKSEFLSNMSHELRTPLNSVLALSQLMLSKGVGANAKKHTEYLAVIERNGRHLLGLINEILDLSKIEAGRMDLAFEDVDAAEVVDEAAATIRPLAVEKGLAFSVDMPRPCPVRCDRDRLKQVLINLLSNAVKFTDAGSVTLAGEVADGRLAVHVTDTGIGIAADRQDYIFDQFRQGDGSTTRRYGGTGLGLAISRKLARIMDGDIAVDSAPGRGSTFTLTVPLSGGDEFTLNAPERNEAAYADETSEPEASPERLTRTVLVVEDNDVASEQIVSVLEELGVRGYAVFDGAEALEALRHRQVDAIILDLMMPGVDGFEVIEAIRGGVAGNAPPVLVLSAKDLSSEEKARLRQAPVHRLLQEGRHRPGATEGGGPPPVGSAGAGRRRRVGPKPHGPGSHGVHRSGRTRVAA